MAEMKTLTAGGTQYKVVDGDAVHYTTQELTDEQKTQARTNIGAMAESELQTAVDEALAQAKASGEFDGADGVNGKDGENGADGVNGKDGDDGISVASVTQTTTSSVDGGTNVITVTLSNGTYSTFSVKNGSKGSTGAGGVSPTIDVSSIEGGHRLTITDANGSKTVDVMDGEDGSGGSGTDGLSIYTDSNTYGGTTMVSATTINVPEGRTVQAGDLIVDGTGKVFLVTSVSGQMVYIEKTDIDLKGQEGSYIVPCGGNCGTGVGATTTHLIYEFHLPDGHTLRVGDRVVCANGYLATVTAISGDAVTLYATGICIKGANGAQGPQGPQGETGPAYTLTNLDMINIANIVKRNLATETWTFELEDGTTVTKAVYVG